MRDAVGTNATYHTFVHFTEIRMQKNKIEITNTVLQPVFSIEQY